MKKEKTEIIEQMEYFELTLNVPNSSIPAADLVQYILNTDKLFKSINLTLNEKYSLGYQSVELDISAFEEGSFKIPVKVRKRVINAVLGVTYGVLGNYAYAMLNNNSGTDEVTLSDGQVVVVDYDVLRKNKSTVDSVNMIANLAIGNDNISDVSITYQKNDGNKERVTISKETLKKTAELKLEDEQMTSLQTQIRLEIVSPVLIDEPASWRVSYNGGTPFMAKMLDTDFIETLESGGIAFGKGDAIIADMETIVTITDKGPKTKYQIIKVHSYPQYRRITRSAAVQGELFGDTEK
jgi:hypothetical protein